MVQQAGYEPALVSAIDFCLLSWAVWRPSSCFFVEQSSCSIQEFRVITRGMKTIQMLQQRVLLTQLPDEPVAVGRLVVPESVAKNLNRGKIVAVAEGRLRIEDEVLFDSRQALPFNYNGKEYLIVHEGQILAVLKKKKQKSKV
jgi:co-chaperonin GroES (HSP10)